jgi:hypothetical protein
MPFKTGNYGDSVVTEAGLREELSADTGALFSKTT